MNEVTLTVGGAVQAYLRKALPLAPPFLVLPVMCVKVVSIMVDSAGQGCVGEVVVGGAGDRGELKATFRVPNQLPSAD